MLRTLSMLAVVTAASLAHAAELVPDPAIDCDACPGWNRPHEPFRVFGNTYYVGTAELGSVLVVTDAGLVLLDGALPQSAPLIAANIEALGYDLDDVEYLMNSHTHHDHAGGLAALQRASGAVMLASPRAAEALRFGGPTLDDPQYGIPENRFAPVGNVRAVADGERIAIGGTTFTAHFTPGHTPGGTTWTWSSCEGERCLSMVYVDSLNAVSRDGFRFGAQPSLVETFGRSIETVAALPCDILLAPHPGFAQLDQKYARSRDGETDAFVDPAGCRSYAAAAARRLEERLRSE